MAKHDKIYLSGGIFTWISEGFEKNLTESADNWYNTSIILSPSSFSLGLNYVILRFQKDGYSTTNFAFQIIINQLTIEVITIDFDDSVDAHIGEDISIEIQLIESGSNNKIDGATVSYSWEYGVGTLDSNTADLGKSFTIRSPMSISGFGGPSIILNSIFPFFSANSVGIIPDPMINKITTNIIPLLNKIQSISYYILK